MRGVANPVTPQIKGVLGGHFCVGKGAKKKQKRAGMKAKKKRDKKTTSKSVGGDSPSSAQTLGQEEWLLPKAINQKTGWKGGGEKNLERRISGMGAMQNDRSGYSRTKGKTLIGDARMKTERQKQRTTAKKEGKGNRKKTKVRKE